MNAIAKKLNALLTAAIVSVWADQDRREEGASAVEYGLLVALIAAVIVTVVTTLGNQVNNAFQTVSSAL